MLVAKGFYTWVDTTNNWNKKTRLLKQAIVYWMKHDEAKAFRRWAQNTQKQEEAKLKRILAQKVAERKLEEQKGQSELKQ